MVWVFIDAPTLNVTISQYFAYIQAFTVFFMFNACKRNGFSSRNHDKSFWCSKGKNKTFCCWNSKPFRPLAQRHCSHFLAYLAAYCIQCVAREKKGLSAAYQIYVEAKKKKYKMKNGTRLLISSTCYKICINDND